MSNQYNGDDLPHNIRKLLYPHEYVVQEPKVLGGLGHHLYDIDQSYYAKEAQRILDLTKPKEKMTLYSFCFAVVKFIAKIGWTFLELLLIFSFVYKVL